MAKYNNKKITHDGLTFDSQKEFARYCQLKLLQRGGIISDLKLQVKFELLPAQKGGLRNERALSYVADFTYYENGKLVIEDVKGMRLPLYLAKRKLMKSIGFEISEI